MQAEIAVLPGMDRKLSTMETSLHSMLQQILLQTARDSTSEPDVASASTLNQKEHITMGTSSHPLPVTNLQTAFQQAQSTIPGLTTVGAPLVSQPTAITTEVVTTTSARDETQQTAPFRISPVTIPTLPSLIPPTILPKNPYTIHQHHSQPSMSTGNFWALPSLDSLTIHLTKHLQSSHWPILAWELSTINIPVTYTAIQ